MSSSKMVAITHDKYVWMEIYSKKLYLKIRKVGTKKDGGVFHTREGVNMNKEEALKFFQAFDSDWKTIEIFHLSSTKVLYYDGEIEEVIVIAPYTCDDDGYHIESGKGIMLRGIEVTTLREVLEEVKQEFNSLNVGGESNIQQKLNEQLERTLNTGMKRDAAAANSGEKAAKKSKKQSLV